MCNDMVIGINGHVTSGDIEVLEFSLGFQLADGSETT